MQAYPPFLVVHTNAAYGRWTGLDSHVLVGQPIANLVSLPEPPASSSTTETRGRVSRLDGAVAQSQDNDHHQQGQAMLLDRLIVASGFGMVHEVRVRTRPTTTLPTNSRNSAAVADEPSRATQLLHSESASGVEFVSCRIALAPIVSTDLNVASGTASWWDQADAADANADLARRRGDHHHHSAPRNSTTRSNRRHKWSPRVTHFVLQLQSDRAGPNDGRATARNNVSDNHSHSYTSQSCSTAATEQPPAAEHPPGAVFTARGPDAVEMEASSVSSEPDAVAAIG
jgi:hypothetical protein